MRIAVLGAGGVGGYFGGRLARAGHDVTFVARGAHLAALREQGLAVESVAGDFVVAPVTATDDTSGVGAVDVVVLCVKTWQLPAAIEALPPLVGRGASGRGVSPRPRHTRPRVGVPGPNPLVVPSRDLNSSSYRACGRCGWAGSVEVAARVRMWRPVGAKPCVAGRGGGRVLARPGCPLLRAPIVHARGRSHPRRGRAPSTELSPDVGEESSGGDTARRIFPRAEARPARANPQESQKSQGPDGL